MDITRLSRFVAGLPRDVDMTANALQVGSLKVGATSPAELTKTMTTLLDTITQGSVVPGMGLPSANLADGAVTSAKLALTTVQYSVDTSKANVSILGSKLAAMRVGVTNFTPTGASSDTVDNGTSISKIRDAASTDTPISPIAAIGAAASKGVFVGTVSGATDVGKVLLRVAGSDNGLDDGTGDEVFGKLTYSGGSYTLSYFCSDGFTPYTMSADDVARKIDFYFVEVMDMWSFKVDTLLMPGLGGVIDATSSDSFGSALSTVQSNLDLEITSRQGADITLQNSLNSEITSRSNADTTLQNNLNSEITSRSDADTTLQNNLNSEITSRSDADTTLQNNLNSEITSRSDADTTLQNNLNSEITSRSNADTTLQNNLNSEITSRQDAVSTLQEELDTTQGTIGSLMNGLTGGFNSGVFSSTTYLQTSSTVTIAFLDLDSALAAESTSRQSADTTLQNNLNSEITSRSDADTTLQNSLNSEITSRSDADTTLQNNLNSEITSRSDADTTLQNNLNSEITSRSDADTTLQNNLNSEITSRSDADTTLQNNLNSEITSRSNADTTLQNSLNSEITSRSDADATLQDQIDALSVGTFKITLKAGEALVVGDVVALSKTVAGQVVKAKGDSITLSSCTSIVGVVTTAQPTVGSDVIIQIAGEVVVNRSVAFTDLGGRAYLSAATAGYAVEVAPADTDNVVYLLGGISAGNKIVLAPHMEYIVTNGGSGFMATIGADQSGIIPADQVGIVPAV